MNKKILWVIIFMLVTTTMFSSAMKINIGSIEEKNDLGLEGMETSSYHREIIIDNGKTGRMPSSYNLSPYWGNEDMQLTNGTGYFDTYQDENDIWWFVDPEGNAFYSVGRWGGPFYSVNVINKYESKEEWANRTMEIIKMTGLNTFGCYENLTRDFKLFEEEIPYLYKFEFQHMGHGRWLKLMGNKVIPDVFDPYFWRMVKEEIIKVTTALKNDSYLIGYFLGNEIHWGPSPLDKSGDKKTLLEAYMFADSFYRGKERVVEFLKNRYENNGGLEEFNRIWNMDLKYFNELYIETELGREGWRILSEYDSDKRKLNMDDSDLIQAESDIRDFTHLVAEWFFKNVTEILHTYDANHITLGVRFHAHGAPREVIDVTRKYCDVISINYYRRKLSRYDYNLYRQSRRVGLVPLGSVCCDDWLKSYYINLSKPLLIAEWAQNWSYPWLAWFFEKFNLPEKSVPSYCENYTRRCMERSYIIGIEGNYGMLVNETEDPVMEIIQRIQNLTDNMYNIHRNATDVNFKTQNDLPFFYNSPLLRWLFERFPNAFLILRQLLGL